MSQANIAHIIPEPKFFIPETGYFAPTTPSVISVFLQSIFRTTLAEFHSRAKRIVWGALIPTTVGLDNPALSQQNIVLS